MNSSLTKSFIMICCCAHLGLTQTVEDRITSILRQMTLAEKILQLHQEGGFNTATNTRLGIPGFVMSDGPHGVRDGMATSFPVGIGMASTWDTDLAQRVGFAMGQEFWSKGKHQALGPCLDIDRDPRNGRSPESGGEDPYLCGQITAAVVRGIQLTPTIATVKHYNANHREDGRMGNNITASQRVLHDDAGLAFRTAVQQGGALSVMNAYTLINNQKCAENFNLLTMILKTQWGFPYYVVSDWGSIWDTGRAVQAGCDICMGSTIYQDNLPTLVANGTVQESVIDQAVRRVLRTKILSGMLDYQPQGDPADVNSAAHQQLCLEAGRKSLVLLKNSDGILPLNASAVGKVALVGPNAAVAQTDGTGSSWVTPFYSISPKQGIESKIGAANVVYAKGCDINSTDTSGFASARSAALQANVVIFCGGLDGSQEGEGFDRVGGSIQLPGKQQDLINALGAANSNLVVVLYSGGICGINRSAASMKGLIYAFYPGQESGRAVADVLFGDYNPAGRLPVTYPKTDDQLPPWLRDDNLDTGYGRGYRWFDTKGFEPQYPFGFGLSYTTFSYSNMTVTPNSIDPGQLVHVSVDVTNTGSRTGEEVVQLYVSDTTAPVPMPQKQLKGFSRISFEPGQKKTVEFLLTADELYYYDETSSSYQVHPGQYAVRVGGSSASLPVSGAFQVLDGARKPDLLLLNVKMVPRYPKAGDNVMFLATVKNQGSKATIQGSPLKVLFSVNGQQIMWTDNYSDAIPAGGMALLCANGGPHSTNQWTMPVDSFNVVANVDPDNAIDECVEDNNSFSQRFGPTPIPPVNLAFRKTVTVSSVEKAGTEGTNVVDGDFSTRWSSAFSDPQS
ncbi:MAG TPA: glycoside hydrolase family 3 C-terminal domain-containing protein, partial [Bacteroidota bacterium]